MSPRRRLLGLGLLVGLAGCSVEESRPTAGEFQPLCGEAAPLRLLPMDPVRVPQVVRTKKYGDRFVIFVDNIHYFNYPIGEIWSVGPCGEDPSVLIQGVVPSAWIFEPWPDIPFVCAIDSGRIFALDVDGATPPNEVFETLDCFTLRATNEGLVTILGVGNTGSLILQPWPDDPLSESAEQVVLADEVRGSGDHLSWYKVFDATETEVFAVTPADELIVVSLEDLGVETLAADVGEFEVAPSGRYVVWQGTEVIDSDPEDPGGPVFLLDRQTGVTTLLDTTSLAHISFGLEAFGLIYYRAGPDADETAGRWFRLDTLEPASIPGSYQVWSIIDDHRVLFTVSGDDESIWIFDASTGELTRIYDSAVYGRTAHDGGIWILRELGGELIDLGYDGESRTLARHVRRPWNLLTGDRVITPYEVDKDGIGSLIVVDPDTLQERYIDHDVLVVSMSAPDRASRDELVVYMVVSEDPARHGIWLAKPK